MLIPTPTMSSTERSRVFRQRHPGYHARIMARSRSSDKAIEEAVRQQIAAQALAVEVQVTEAQDMKQRRLTDK